MNPETSFIVAVGLGAVAWATWILLRLKDEKTGRRRESSWKAALLVLPVVVGGLLAALLRRSGEDLPAHPTLADPPPEPTADDVAVKQIKNDHQEAISEVEEAEQDPDELARLKKLTEA